MLHHFDTPENALKAYSGYVLSLGSCEKDQVENGNNETLTDIDHIRKCVRDTFAGAGWELGRWEGLVK